MKIVSTPAGFFFTCCSEKVRKELCRDGACYWEVHEGKMWVDLYKWCVSLSGWLEGRFILGNLYIFHFSQSQCVAWLCWLNCLLGNVLWQSVSSGPSSMDPTLPQECMFLLIMVLYRVFLMSLAIALTLCKWWSRCGSVFFCFYLVRIDMDLIGGASNDFFFTLLYLL